MRAIFIDTENQKIEEVDGEGLVFLQSKVQGSIEVARYIGNNVIYVNDEGLLEQSDFFLLKEEDGIFPFAGNGIVVGTTEEGADADCSVDIEWLKKAIEFNTLEEVQMKYALGLL